MIAERVLKQNEEYQSLLRAVSGKKGAVALFGLSATARAAVLCSLCEDSGRPALVISPGEAEAGRFAADCTALGQKSAVYPARDYVLRAVEGQSREYEYRRLEVLGQLCGKRVNIVTAGIEAVMQRTLPKQKFIDATLTIKPSMQLKQAELALVLLNAGYLRREQVDGPGQFSVRGGIVDIYAPDMESPARLEYWGDEIESIHTFDLVSQRREGELKKIYISPAREVLFGGAQHALQVLQSAIKSKKGAAQKSLEAAVQADISALEGDVMPEGMDKYIGLLYEKAAGIIDYLENAIIFFDEPSGIREEAKNVIFRAGEEHKTLLEEGVLEKSLYAGQGTDCFYQDINGLMQQAQKQNSVFAENFSRSVPDVPLIASINLPAHALPAWNGSLAALQEEIDPLLAEGYFCAVLAGTSRSASALNRDLTSAGYNSFLYKKTGEKMPEFESTAKIGTVAVMPGHLSQGAAFPKAGFALITSRRHAEIKQKTRKKSKGLSSIQDIKPGDYVVHQSHGIGLYSGIRRMDMQGVVKDYLTVNYSKGDVLYVPVTQLDLLSRYTAPGDGENIKLAKLGGGDWAKAKARVRTATNEMAQELIELYAKRREAKGFAFDDDSEWQHDFEARFEYDETPDQLISAKEIKEDMQRPHPMDRLLCGDVGVGKTEVALRAAFKCITSGKQCAILVPTTILAWQHYNTIISRMEAFPVKVEMLSRFRTPKQIKEALKGLANGTVDIVVGTHRLIQKDIKFKDLGLLIIDEEQRFGVKHKEKLKEMFIGVDTLTLSATPIPRTLNMALSGIRDLSTIEEPPTERQPVETYVMEYDEGIIASAIKKELARGGQVYYLHNRVETIDVTALKIQQLVPEARIATAHGKMNEESLSHVWQQLLDCEIDVLVCTTLIETGVDVRNCNTLIIEDADRMGLAQLYQIRGRVGRSGRKAYAYLTFKRDKVLTDIASKRLSAIREFTSFGSGFRIAMRDLQIRGAGNLLGQSQSGHISAVGYDLYVKMLNQAVALARGETPPPDKAETLIDITVDAFIPEKYIADSAGRIEAYKKIAAIENEADAQDVQNELTDRYGPLPESAKGLIDISLARVLAAQLGFYEINQNKDTIIFYSDKIDLAALRPALREFSSRVMVNNSAKPYIAVKVQSNEKPLEVLKKVIFSIPV